MQNQKKLLPQDDKPLAEQEVNSVTSSYRVPAPVASTGPTDSGGEQQFCMMVDLTPNSTQGGEDGTVQDTVVPENSVHPPNAPENGAENKNQMSYAAISK